MRGSLSLVTDLPITRTSPAFGFVSPVIRLSVVDFPQPVGPTIATNSPGRTTKLKSRSAVCDAPVGETNRRVTPVSSIAGAAAGERRREHR